MRVAGSESLIEQLPTRMVNLEEQAFKEFAAIFGPKFRSFFFETRIISYGR